MTLCSNHIMGLNDLCIKDLCRETERQIYAFFISFHFDITMISFFLILQWYNESHFLATHFAHSSFDKERSVCRPPRHTIDHFKSVFEHFPAVDAELTVDGVPYNVCFLSLFLSLPPSTLSLSFYLSVRVCVSLCLTHPLSVSLCEQVGTFSCGEVKPSPAAGSVKPPPVARSFF